MTRVIQSYRKHDVPVWIDRCLTSVRSWADAKGYEYHCADDEVLLGTLPEWFRQKVGERWPMLVDLGRLKLCQRALANGCERVVWLDADVLVVDPERLVMPEILEYGYAFGRELWVEEGGKVRRGVHNAVCVFERGNPVLDFYAHACERIIAVHEGDKLAPQLLGPKLLKALYTFTQMPLLDEIGMLSPWVTEDLLAGGGRRLDVMMREIGEMPPALNLCSSMISDEVGDAVTGLLLSGDIETVL